MSVASILHHDVGTGGKWIATACVLGLLGFILATAIRVPEGPFGPLNTRLESVLWTSTPDCQTFYGPGTPQSLALAHKLYDGNYLDASFRVPDVPIYVAPAEVIRVPNGHPIFLALSRKPVFAGRDAPQVIYNFSPEIAETLRKAHSPVHHAEKDALKQRELLLIPEKFESWDRTLGAKKSTEPGGAASLPPETSPAKCRTTPGANAASPHSKSDRFIE
jgi:hypothetical protein